MFALLMLAMLGQIQPLETWRVNCPYGHPINVRGHREGDRFLASFPVAQGVPPATINFGVDMSHALRAPDVRGTDKDLGRELAGKLIEQRCPNPGPCPPQPPRPPRLPDPTPDLPEAPPINVTLIGIAVAFGLGTLFLIAAFLILLLIGRRRP